MTLWMLAWSGCGSSEPTPEPEPLAATRYLPASDALAVPVFLPADLPEGLSIDVRSVRVPELEDGHVVVLVVSNAGPRVLTSATFEVAGDDATAGRRTSRAEARLTRPPDEGIVRGPVEPGQSLLVRVRLGWEAAGAVVVRVVDPELRDPVHPETSLPWVPATVTGLDGLGVATRGAICRPSARGTVCEGSIRVENVGADPVWYRDLEVSWGPGEPVRLELRAADPLLPGERDHYRVRRTVAGEGGSWSFRSVESRVAPWARRPQ